MTPNLAQQVHGAMARRQQLERQRQAASVIARRYAAVRSVASWAAFVARLDEPRPYHLAFRIAEREA